MSMNITIARAMFREQFQRTAPILVLCLGISTVFPIVQYLFARGEVTQPGASVVPNAESSVLTVSISLILGVLALLYCHSDERDIKLNIPHYLLLLPLRTLDLVLFRMGYTLLCVALIGIWSSGIYYLLFGVEMQAIFSFWEPMLYGVTIFAILQALAWCIGGSGFGVILTALTIHLLANWLFFDFKAQFGDITGTIAGDALSLVAASFLVAYVGIRTRRREGIAISKLLGPLSYIFMRDRGVERPPFQSPEEAMRWFEWRRQGRILPAGAIFASIVFSIFAVSQVHKPLISEYPFNSAMTVYFVAITIAFYTALGVATISCGCYTLFQNQRIQLGPEKTFLFIRPVSTKDLATARIAATLKSVLIAIPPFVIVCAITIFFAARADDPNGLPGYVQERIGLDGAAIALFLLLGFMTIIWCAQWFGNVLAALAIVALPAITFSILSESGVISETAGYLYTARVFSAIAIPGCAYLFYLAHKRGQLEMKHIYMALAVMPLLAAGCFTFMNLDNFLNAEPYDFIRAVHLIPFAILPIAPLATIPLVMNYARHR